MDSCTVQSHSLVGSIAIWVGWWTCAVFAGEKFMSSWWLDPRHRAVYTRAALEAPRLPHEAVPWQVVFRDHPSTISEMMGETHTAQGAVAQALCLPGTLLCVIGGFMVYTCANGFTNAVLSFCRASAPGIGLMMVIYTPVLTLMPDFVKTRVSSELEDCWWHQWVQVHVLGFLCCFGSVLLLEFPAMIHRLWWWSAATQDMAGRYIYLLVTICCACSCILSLLAILQMEKPAKEPDTASYRKFTAEYAALRSFAFLYMLSACAVWLDTAGENSWFENLFVAGGVIYTLYEFMSKSGPVRQVMWLFHWDSLDFSKIVGDYVKKHQDGEVMQGMIKLTDNDLFNIYMCQAGQACSGDDTSHGPHGAFGSKHPKVMQFVVRPKSYLTIEATDFHQLSRDDLRFFNADFALVLGQLASAEIIYFPYGTKFKFERKLPFVRVSCKDYRAEVAHIDKNLTPNTLSYTHDKDTKFVAYDITERVLRDKRTAFLATTPLIEAFAKGDCFGMYELFGTLLGDSTPPFKHVLTRPGLKTPDGLNYEIQLRGITAAPPSVFLHVLEGQDMPTGWIESPSESNIVRRRTVHELDELEDEKKTSEAPEDPKKKKLRI